MERLGVLIDKLKQQFQDKAGKDQLMVTLGLIQAELMQAPSHQTVIKKASVAVIVPAARNLTSETFHAQQQHNHHIEEKVVEMLQVDEKEIKTELEQIRKNAERKNEMGMTHRHMIDEIADPMGEIPTLASHEAYKPKISDRPVRETSVEPAANSGNTDDRDNTDSDSLNDRLKETKTELADRLQDTPVKDLKKAIGINDRYLYIIELFSGNEAMFDRSIKTLNSFSILPEAEFWMERELKLKLGWQETNPLVKQFIQLVRRRFS